EPGELNEHPVRAEVRGGALRAVVVHTDLQIATQGAVLGLLAAIEPRIGAGPQGEVLPVLPVFGADRDTGERPVRHARTVVISVFPTNISADLEADIGARDVVEAVAVKAADLHVLHRRRLDRQFGGLSATDRNQSRGRPEENAFHDLTFSALNLRGIYFTKNLHGVRGDRQRQRATLNTPAMQFSAGCCRNNTSLKAVGLPRIQPTARARKKDGGGDRSSPR